jgi:hypothetical protein
MTAQISEKLLFEGEKHSMCTNPLGDYCALGGELPRFASNPRRPPKLPHLWPPKLPHPAGGDLMHRVRHAGRLMADRQDVRADDQTSAFFDDWGSLRWLISHRPRL